MGGAAMQRVIDPHTHSLTLTDIHTPQHTVKQAGLHSGGGSHLKAPRDGAIAMNLLYKPPQIEASYTLDHNSSWLIIKLRKTLTPQQRAKLPQLWNGLTLLMSSL